MTHFTIFPAIDLRNGKVVRLKYGDPDQQTTFSDSPRMAALNWKKAGAKWVHVVNLDAAFGQNSNENLEAIREIITICHQNDLKMQLGGGIRTLEAIESWLTMGVTRVILGTVAVKNPDLVENAVSKFGPEKIVIGVDARDGWVKTHGWKERSEQTVVPFVLKLKNFGINTVIYTDISRDGVGGGINMKITSEIAYKSGMQIIASGGISTFSDVVNVKNAGISGVVIGRALYEGTIDPYACFNLQEGE